MGSALVFYRDYTGLQVISDDPWPEDTARRLFRLPAGVRARVVTLEGGLQKKTKLKLIEFRPGSGKRIREGARPWDIGFYCITYLVQDLEKIGEELEGKGYSFVAPARRYTASFAPTGVSERTLIGPEGIAVNHFQRHSGEDYGVKRNYIQLDHCLLQVESLDEAQRFLEVIGLDCLLGNTEIPPGIIEPIIGLPPGHRIRESAWGAKDRTTAGCEFLEIKPQGKMLAGRPPDTGYFMLSFVVDSVDSALLSTQKAGFTPFSGPLPAGAPGTARCAIVEGPSGILFYLEDEVR
jgi:hypothetical protein